MLQIISGRFFKSQDRYRTPKKAILYSNLSWIGQIETSVAVLEPVHVHQEIASYVLSFIVQIEKRPIPSLVCAGEDEVVNQFRLFCMLGLGGYFAPEQAEVEYVCRTSSRHSGDKFVPRQFVPWFFDKRRALKKSDTESFVRLIEKAITLKRERYRAVIGALSNIQNALGALSYSLDLAYSMLVYSLESLLDNSSQPSLQWGDFNEDERAKLDPILERADEQLAEELRQALLKSRHLRLQKRFVEFVEDNIDDEFFWEEAHDVPFALRRSSLTASLKTAYRMRSRFVHEVLPLVSALRIPATGAGDTYYIHGIYHLTFAGLLRIVLHVLKNVVLTSESVESEEIDWMDEMPNLVELQYDPSIWVANPASLNRRNIHWRFTGFLEHFQMIRSRLRGKKPVTVAEMGKLMARIEELLPSLSDDKKRALLAVYWLYNASVIPEAKRPDWEDFLTRYDKEMCQCCIELIAVRVFMGLDLPWGLSDCLQAFDRYAMTRHSKKGLLLSALVETAVLGQLANMAIAEKGDIPQKQLVKRAISETAGRPRIQAHLMDCIENQKPVDVSRILDAVDDFPDESKSAEARRPEAT